MLDVMAFVGRAEAVLGRRAAVMQVGWRSMGEFLLGVRVAVVPVVSVAIGLFMFYAVGQVHDLFLETAGTRVGGVLLWVVFYACVLLGWVLAVYLSSRWILARYNSLADSTHEDSLIGVPAWVSARLPRILAVTCLTAVLIGQFQAILTSPEVVWHPEELKEKLHELSTAAMQAQKERNNEPAVGLQQFLVYVFLFLMFLLPVPMLRLRRWLTTRTNRYLRIGGWIAFAALCVCALLPYLAVLGFATNGEYVAVSLQYAEQYLPRAEPSVLILCLYAVAATPIALWYLRRLTPLLGSRVLRYAARTVYWSGAAAAFAGILMAAGIVIVTREQLAESLLDPFAPMHLAILPMLTLLLAWAVWRTTRWIERDYPVTKNWNWPFAALLVVSVLAIGGLMLTDPLVSTRYLNRAPLLAVGLGVWVPLLTAVTLASYRLRTPLLVFAVAILAGVGWVVGDTYEIRTTKLPDEIKPNDASGYTIDESLRLWAKANGDCRLPAKATGAEELSAPAESECPKPVIVLAAGGASRASFFVTSVLGKLMDDYDGRNLSNRLFAISGVSGGSLAAVTFQAALADSMLRADSTSSGDSTATLRPPCRDQPQSDRLTALSSLVDDASAKPSATWWACMMALQSGDFLSPTMVSLLFTDLVNFGLWPDRAATLERAWERRYLENTGQDTLQHNLLGLRPKLLEKGHWLPHLVLNGTSVSTGRRIVASDFVTVVSSDGRPCQIDEDGGFPTHCSMLFKDAYDLHDLLWYEGAIESEHPILDIRQMRPTRDIRLSTAATLSARFPVLSPHGTIRDNKGRPIDRVVDGGYFENNGALTAIDIADVLREKGLKPIILLITNEPTRRAVGCDTEAAEKPPLGRTTSFIGFSLLRSPLDALMGTREARGTLASVALCRLLKDSRDSDFVHIRVEPQQGKTVSMSWWLSHAVQIYLGSEAFGRTPRDRNSTTNDEAYRKLREAFSPRTAQSSDAPAQQ